MSLQRPNIFQYQDYVEFLKDWLTFRRSGQSTLSMRQLARQASLASGYLPMVLSRKRPLSHSALVKLMPFLGLAINEQSFLEKLLVLGTSLSHDARVASFEGMQRFQGFQKENSRDNEVYKYQSHWQNVIIREMATMPGFRLDPEWIRDQLRFPVPLKSIKDAVSFLLEKGYIELKPDGSVNPPQKSLECSGETYRVALTKFHREILNLAGKSIENTASDERSIKGHTCALSPDNFVRARAILDSAIEQIRDLGANENTGDCVYHMEVALFPFTDRKRSAK